jgi:outer membrane protein assembly factor BamB
MTTPQPTTFAVVPVLIGPAQVLLAIVPAIVLAILGRVFARLRPSAVRSTAQLLWRRKFAVATLALLMVATVYAWPRIFPHTVRGDGQAERGATDWPIFRGGADRRGIAGDPSAIVDPVAGGINWTFSNEFTTFDASPAVAGHALYVSAASIGVYTDRGAVFCIDARNGAMIWKFAPSDYRATYSSPVVSGKYVVVGEGLHYTPDARILCLDADTGKKIWELRTRSKVESTPCIDGDRAYVGAGDDGLYCIALAPNADGSPNVLFHLDGKQYQDCDASPIVYQGKVYWGLGVGGCAVACVDAKTGAPIWRAQGRFPVFTSPTVAGGKIIAGMGNGNLIESADDVQRRTIQEMRSKGASPAEIDAAVASLAPGGAVWALDPDTGRKIWEIPLTQTVLGEVAFADDELYFGCQDGMLRVADLDGHVLREWNARDPIPSSPAVGRDHVYFVTQSGQLTALTRSTLEPTWTISIGEGGPFLSSPVISNGRVYVGTASNGLICAGQPRDAAAESIWPSAGGGKAGWVDDTALPAEGQIAWQYPFPNETDGNDRLPPQHTGTVTAAPAFHRGALYAAMISNNHPGLAKLLPSSAARKTPAEAWSIATMHKVSIAPVAGGGRIYLTDGAPGDADRRVIAVDEANGHSRWSHPVASGASGEMLLLHDCLIVADQPDTLTALAIAGDKPGQVLWSRPKTRLVGAIGVVDDIPLVATTDQRVLALDRLTGAVLCEMELKSMPTTGPTAVQKADGTRLAVVGTEKGLVGVRMFTKWPQVEIASLNRIAWALPSGPVVGSIVASAHHVAFTTADGELIVAAIDGPILARASDALPGVAPLIAGDRVLYAAKGSLQFLELGAPTNPPKLWLKTDRLGSITAGPILIDSQVYFGTRNNGLVAARSHN